MSQSINMIVIAGRLGQDPKLRAAGSQDVCSFSVATTRSWKDKSDEWQEKVEWHNVVVWGRDAKKCDENLRKGSSVTVHGRLESRTYEKDGEEKRVYEIIAERVFFDVKKSEGGGRDRDDDRGRSRDDDRGRSKDRADDRRRDRDDDDRAGGRSSSRRDDRDDDRDDRGFKAKDKGKPRKTDDKPEEFGAVPF